MKRHVYLAQISTAYGRSVFLPYSVGSLWAYAQTIPAIAEAYELKDFLVRREPIADVVARLDHPAVLGLSCYQWNWIYSHTLAEAVKDMYPECLIVMGGPQVPMNAANFFQQYPHVDVLVHGEGEVTFAEMLTTLATTGFTYAPEMMTIPGLSLVSGDNRKEIRTSSRGRITDLSILPSPYVNGLFDGLLTGDWDWQMCQETSVRGCPFSCNFCVWGSATQSKIYQFPEERILREFDWCGEHKIRFLYSCDANYGILQRDVDLTRSLVDTKAIYDYPREFRACYAKNSGERVFQIASLLNDAGMNKGVTLSLQSLDPHTLQEIKRSNIKMDDFAHWMRRYHEAGIATYTELIMGLPGETYDTFVDGIDRLLEAGQHEHINVYMCQLLPNSEMSDPAYIAQHGIQSVRMPVLLQHSTPQPDAMTEYHDIVVETATLPVSDWGRCYLFAWAVQTFHCLGLTRQMAMYLRQEYGVSYRDFYQALTTFAADQMGHGPIGEEYWQTMSVLQGALRGQPWDVVYPTFGDIIWPTEEASFLQLATAKTPLAQDLAKFIHDMGRRHGFTMHEDVAQDLIRYQLFMVNDPHMPQTFHLECDYNWHSYFETLQRGMPIELIRGTYLMDVEAGKSYGGDLEAWAREVVWFGRKSGHFLYTDVKETALVG